MNALRFGGHRENKNCLCFAYIIFIHRENYNVCYIIIDTYKKIILPLSALNILFMYKYFIHQG